MTDTDIGSLESQKKGSAARYNANKPVWSYMPLTQISGLMLRLKEDKAPIDLYQLTDALGKFQSRGTKLTAFDVLELGTRYFMQVTNSTFDQAMQHVIKVWELGEKKYAKFNWMKGMPWSEPINSAQRHVMHMFNGDQIDPDSGEHHAAHFICNAMMLVHYVEWYSDGNDLPTEWFS